MQRKQSEGGGHGSGNRRTNQKGLSLCVCIRRSEGDDLIRNVGMGLLKRSASIVDFVSLFSHPLGSCVGSFSNVRHINQS